LPHRIEEPPPKYIFVEENIVKTDPVQLWLNQEFLFGEFPIEYCEPHDRQRCEAYVIKLVEPEIINVRSTEF